MGLLWPVPFYTRVLFYKTCGWGQGAPCIIVCTGQHELLRRENQDMNKKIKTDAVDHLFDAVLTLKNPEECYKFFEDVCTINELLSLSQRYEVAKMLREGKTYLEIADKTGASTATISRVNRSLNYGSDGYDMVFARLQVDTAKPKTEKED